MVPKDQQNLINKHGAFVVFPPNKEIVYTSVY
jgi:hypothetical protein